MIIRSDLYFVYWQMKLWHRYPGLCVLYMSNILRVLCCPLTRHVCDESNTDIKTVSVIGNTLILGKSWPETGIVGAQ